MKHSDRRPGYDPITKIELNEGHMKLRTVLLVLSVTIAVISLAAGLTGLLHRKDTGWRQIQVESTEVHLGEEFLLQYDFSPYGKEATPLQKNLTVLYTELMEQCYVVFDREMENTLVGNLAYVNRHPNQVLTVDPLLYRAFETVQAHSSRYLYLGPVYTEQNRIFLTENPQEAEAYDPAQNEELLPYLQEVTAFAADPAHINLELLGDNQVQLQVSPDYLEFAKTYEIAALLDFGWTRNAFVVDAVAEALTEKGWTLGSISSYEGYARNLDSRELDYSVNVFDRLDNDLYIPAVMHYQGPASIVTFRNYPLSELDRWHYYSFDNGSIATTYLDPADGRSKSSTDNLLGYAYDRGCADLLLELAPLYIADTLDEEALRATGIHTIWAQDTTLRYTDPELILPLKEAEDAPEYTKELVE